MNRVYKTKWSAAHQQYVVTDEHHATKGKASKSAVAIAVGERQKFCVHGIIGARQTGASNEHEHQTQFS